MALSIPITKLLNKGGVAGEGNSLQCHSGAEIRALVDLKEQVIDARVSRSRGPDESCSHLSKDGVLLIKGIQVRTQGEVELGSIHVLSSTFSNITP